MRAHSHTSPPHAHDAQHMRTACNTRTRHAFDVNTPPPPHRPGYTCTCTCTCTSSWGYARTPPYHPYHAHDTRSTRTTLVIITRTRNRSCATPPPPPIDRDVLAHTCTHLHHMRAHAQHTGNTLPHVGTTHPTRTQSVVRRRHLSHRPEHTGIDRPAHTQHKTPGIRSHTSAPPPPPRCTRRMYHTRTTHPHRSLAHDDCATR